MPNQAHRLADAVSERRDVLDETPGRLVGVVGTQSPAAQAHRVAGEPVAEERQEETPAGLAGSNAPVDEDQWWSLPVHPSGDLGAVGGAGSVDTVVTHMSLLVGEWY